MPEPTLIQQQRELLREFRRANTRYAQAESDAAAQMDEVIKAQEQTRTALARIDLEHLLARIPPSSPVVYPTNDPVQELNRSAVWSLEAYRNVRSSVEGYFVRQRITSFFLAGGISSMLFSVLLCYAAGTSGGDQSTKPAYYFFSAIVLLLGVVLLGTARRGGVP